MGKEYVTEEVECPHCEEGYHYSMASGFNARRMEMYDYDVKSECGECEGTGILFVEREME